MKTLDINCRFHRDKTGNSYFGGHIVIDFGTKTVHTITIPDTYGYDDMYIYESFKILKENGYKLHDKVIVRYSNVEVSSAKKLKDFINNYAEVDSSQIVKDLIKANS